MSFEVEGRLHKKFDTAQVTDSFKKREFVVEMEDGAYTQIIKFQLTQNNCDKLDPFNEGDQMKVTFNLRGREYTKNDETMYFTNLEAWRIEKAGEAVAQPVAGDNLDAFPAANDEPSTDSTDTDDLPF
jgi:translation initiation factor IF-3